MPDSEKTEPRIQRYSRQVLPDSLSREPHFMAPGQKAFVALQLLFTSVSVVFFVRILCVHWFPPPGVAIALIAVIAATMSIHSDMGRYHKAFWMAIIGAFLVLELVAIVHERREQARQQKSALEEARAHFGDIGDGIKGAITQSSQGFKETMDQFGKIVRKTERVTKLTKESIEDVTGGDSFGFVVPQTFAFEEFPLRVWNHGRHQLTGVSVTIANTTNDPNWGSGFYQPIYIGNIGPGDSLPVPNYLIRPRPDPKLGQDSYWIFISAQNGSVSQSLYFRRNKKGAIPWAYSYIVTKPTSKKERINGVMTDVTIMQQVLQRRWSDEVQAPH